MGLESGSGSLRYVQYEIFLLIGVRKMQSRTWLDFPQENQIYCVNLTLGNLCILAIDHGNRSF